MMGQDYDLQAGSHGMSLEEAFVRYSAHLPPGMKRAFERNLLSSTRYILVRSMSSEDKDRLGLPLDVYRAAWVGGELQVAVERRARPPFVMVMNEVSDSFPKAMLKGDES